VRLSDLLGAEVVDASGNALGHVRDVRLVADGPPQGDAGPALRLHGLLVGRGAAGARLGLARDRVRGPWLLKLLFGRRPHHEVAWSRVASIGDRRIELRPE
jgi:sporulation protein YlmC with PRC-barrel domain